MSGLRLVHDVLDAQLVDRKKEKVGRVDELTLELRENAPPRVAAILVGGAARAERMGRPFMWLRKLLHRSATSGESRVDFAAMRIVADTIELEVDGETLPSGHLERWLGEHIVCRIPGASGESK